MEQKIEASDVQHNIQAVQEKIQQVVKESNLNTKAKFAL